MNLIEVGNAQQIECAAAPVTVQVRVLVEEGHANVLVQDRWGNTPLDEARRVGATLVVSYLEQAVVKRREAELALRAEQQRLLSANSVAPSVSNWRREQQLQQQLRSQEITELYRLRQVQAQQVRQLSSSILGSDTRAFEQQDAPAAAPAAAVTQPPDVAAVPDAPPTPATAGAQLSQPGGSAAGAVVNDPVGQLMQLAAQAQQALTLKVEEMELDYVENLQQKKQQLQQQRQQAPGGNGSSSGTGNGGGSSSKVAAARGGNNVVSAPKLQQQQPQQPPQQPAVYPVRVRSSSQAAQQ